MIWIKSGRSFKDRFRSKENYDSVNSLYSGLWYSNCFIKSVIGRTSECCCSENEVLWSFLLRGVPTYSYQIALKKNYCKLKSCRQFILKAWILEKIIFSILFLSWLQNKEKIPVIQHNKFSRKQKASVENVVLLTFNCLKSWQWWRRTLFQQALSLHWLIKIPFNGRSVLKGILCDTTKPIKTYSHKTKGKQKPDLQKKPKGLF